MSEHLKQLLSEIIKKTTEESQTQAAKNYRKFPFIRKGVELNFFKDSLAVFAQNNLIKRNAGHIRYEIDSPIEAAMSGLYKFASMQTEKNRGIILNGGFGTGKTLLVHSFIDLIEFLAEKRNVMINAHRVSALEICAKASDEAYFNKLKKGLLFIDDLGREPKTVKDYGNDRSPIVELLSARYDSGEVTIATSNYKLEHFKEWYGAFTYERFIEMFYVITMSGKSRRY